SGKMTKQEFFLWHQEAKEKDSIINSVGEIQLSLIGTIFVYAKKGHDILISSKPRRILKEGKFMSDITIIKQLWGILDNNIQIGVPEGMALLPTEKYQDVNYIVVEGVLTYKPKACIQCGVKNTGSHD